MSLRLDGRVAIVTGGSRGIGIAIAQSLLDAGASVAVCGTSADKVRAAESTLAPPAPDRVLALCADVRDEQQVHALVQSAVDRFGGVDIVVNNAGVGHFGEVAATSLDEWRAVLDTNLTGVFLVCHEAIPHLRRRGGGWIINISSLAGKNPFAGGAAYCASKAGLNAFSEALMQEVRYDDIRVSYILPGSVRTGFTGRDEAGTDWKLTAQDVAQVVLDLVGHDRRSLPSRVELRPAKPRK